VTAPAAVPKAKAVAVTGKPATPAKRTVNGSPTSSSPIAPPEPPGTGTKNWLNQAAAPEMITTATAAPVAKPSQLQSRP
jgi:hypothetical protein